MQRIQKDGFFLFLILFFSFLSFFFFIWQTTLKHLTVVLLTVDPGMA